jgi:hypothetical protein
MGYLSHQYWKNDQDMAAERIATEQEASIIGQSNMSTTDLRMCTYQSAKNYGCKLLDEVEDYKPYGYKQLVPLAYLEKAPWKFLVINHYDYFDPINLGFTCRSESTWNLQIRFTEVNIKDVGIFINGVNQQVKNPFNIEGYPINAQTNIAIEIKNNRSYPSPKVTCKYFNDYRTGDVFILTGSNISWNESLFP